MWWPTWKSNLVRDLIILGHPKYVLHLVWGAPNTWLSFLVPKKIKCFTAIKSCFISFSFSFFYCSALSFRLTWPTHQSYLPHLLTWPAYIIYLTYLPDILKWAQTKSCLVNWFYTKLMDSKPSRPNQTYLTFLPNLPTYLTFLPDLPTYLTLHSFVFTDSQAVEELGGKFDRTKHGSLFLSVVLTRFKWIIEKTFI